MSQATKTPIVTYHSTVAAAVPSNANLQAGELAVNIADMKLYTENSGGTVTLLASADAAAGNFTTVDTTNLEVTNIKAKDGTAAIVLTDATGAVTVSSPFATTGNTTLGNASADTVTVTGTITSNLIFTDNTYDIGASGVTRPRNLFLAGNATIGGSIAATTLDLTNLEVTNIKAKDGTASASIADATGVMTIGSSILTTTDINGGTIDGAAIGGTTPAAGAFTTVSASGTITGQQLHAIPSSGNLNGIVRIQSAGVAVTRQLLFYDSSAVLIAAISNLNSDMYYDLPTGGIQNHRINGVTISSISATGLAVTGSISSTGAVNVGSDGVSAGAYTNVITLASPAASGSTRGDFSRILDVAGSRSLDTGVSSSGAWLQSRDQNDYSVNYTLQLNPNGGSTTVGGGLAVTGTINGGAIGASVASGYGFITNQTGGGDKLRITPLAAGSGATVDIVNNAESDYEPLGLFAEAINLYIRSGAGTTATALSINPVANAVNYWYLYPNSTGNTPTFMVAGSDTNIGTAYSTKGTGQHLFYSHSTTALQFVINSSASAVNRLVVSGAPTTGYPFIYSEGTDTNVGMSIITKGSGFLQFGTDADSGVLKEQVRITHTASANRYITLTGSNGGNPTIGTSAGNLKISSQIEAPAGTVTLPTYTFTGAQTTGFNYSGDGGAEIVASGVTQCTFKNNIGLRMLNTTQIGFASGTPTTTAIDTAIGRKAAGILSVDTATAGDGLGAIHMAERTAPSAPATNGVYIYAEDNGAGKTRLMARFATGAAQQIAIEP